MAKKPICKIDGCGKPRHAKGFCASHHLRWTRHGDPFAGRPIRDVVGPQKFITETAVKWLGQDCLIWPFSVDATGYGYTYFNGKKTGAHRIVCILAHGEPPTPDRQSHAAHSCGNRLCVNPSHIRWATPAENEQDKADQGRRLTGFTHPMCVMTPDKIKSIRALNGTMTQKEIAALHSVSQSAVGFILTGRRWADIT